MNFFYLSLSCKSDRLSLAKGCHESGERNYAIEIVFDEHAFFQSVAIANIARSPIDSGDSESIDQKRYFGPVRGSLD